MVTDPGPQEADFCLEIRVQGVYCKAFSGVTLFVCVWGGGLQRSWAVI